MQTVYVSMVWKGWRTRGEVKWNTYRQQQCVVLKHSSCTSYLCYTWPTGRSLPWENSSARVVVQQLVSYHRPLNVQKVGRCWNWIYVESSRKKPAKSTSTTDVLMPCGECVNCSKREIEDGISPRQPLYNRSWEMGRLRAWLPPIFFTTTLVAFFDDAARRRNRQFVGGTYRRVLKWTAMKQKPFVCVSPRSMRLNAAYTSWRKYGRCVRNVGICTTVCVQNI